MRKTTRKRPVSAKPPRFSEKAKPPAPPARPKPPPLADPVAFWLAQHGQAKRDARDARKFAPSVVPHHVRLEREAWRELTSARAAAALTASPATATTPATPAAAPDASLEAEFAAAQRMRRAAEAAGSYVAAAKLLKAEGEVAVKIRLRDEHAEKAKRKGMTEDDLVEALADRIAAMPEKMRQKVLSRLGPAGVN